MRGEEVNHEAIEVHEGGREEKDILNECNCCLRAVGSGCLARDSAHAENRLMKAGKMTSVENGLERNVEIRITAEEIYSEMAKPPEVIPSDDVFSYELYEKMVDGVSHIHLGTNHFRTGSFQRVLVF